MAGFERFIGLFGSAAMVVLGDHRGHVATCLESEGESRHFERLQRVDEVVFEWGMHSHYFLCALSIRILSGRSGLEVPVALVVRACRLVGSEEYMHLDMMTRFVHGRKERLTTGSMKALEGFVRL
jgi:hypothetical protein